MNATKKSKSTSAISTENSIVVDTLKEKYFQLLKQERSGATRKLSMEIDALEAAIRREIELHNQ